MTVFVEDGVRAVLLSEDPALRGRFDETYPSVWPEYNLHSDVLSGLWPRLYRRFPGFQFVLISAETGQLLARGNTVPFEWDGSGDGLPEGIDALAEAALGDGDLRAPNALSAMAAEVPPEHRGKGLGTLLLKAMSAVGAANGLGYLVAPVRPSRKEQYPLTPIEAYAAWKAADGRLFDPWMRLHENLGARVVKPAPHSLRISGTVGEWESWTGIEFPASGTYVFPRGLSTLLVDRDADFGLYWEPNVWMQHLTPRR
ncbi:MAG TPA: hypothetical protein VHJ78_06020 [Actinomycetota bacterium]|nr:hypothetical protein [Actinomycetota bacterium]